MTAKTKKKPQEWETERDDYLENAKGPMFFGLKLDEAQQAFRDTILDDNITLVFCDAKAGTGKALCDSTEIPTPNGYMKIGNLKVGDFVFDRTGKPTKVLGVYPQGECDVWCVEFNDGRKVYCNEEHIWTVNSITSRKKTVDLTTKQMFDKGIKYDRNNRFKVPINEEIEYSEKNLHIDPYVVGALIGDGWLTGPVVTMCSDDEFVVNKVAEKLDATSKRCREEAKDNFSWVFALKEQSGVKNGTKYLQTKSLPEELNCIKCLAGQKSIPENYKYGSIEQRLELINGLFDTDGSVTISKGGSGKLKANISYSTTSKHLCDDVVEVLRSLGYSCTVYEDKRNNKTYNCCYEIHVQSCYEKRCKLFTLPRKAAKLTVDNCRSWHEGFVSIENIYKTDRKESMTCIYVDNDEHLFLANDFIVTHNTVIATGCAEMLVKSGKYDGIVYITAPVQERNMGYLPGTVEEKTDIYSEPFIIALEKCGINPYLAVKHDEEDNKYSTAYIECRPHNYLRGLTFENKVVIVDESQNLHTSELKKVLTRMSDNCKVIVLGHVGQVDLPREEMSGFKSYLFAACDAVEEKEWMAICTLTKNYRGEMSQWADNVNKLEEN